MVDMTLPFQLSWLGFVLSEMATLIFITVTGYKFRPAEKNPYLTLDNSDELEMREDKHDIESVAVRKD